MGEHPIMHTMLESIMILIFEMLGTGMLTMAFIATGGGITLFIAFFILLILSARISGSHYNPVVTLAFMLRKDAGQFNKWLGILYMLFQTGGAILGALLTYYCFRESNTVLTLVEPYHVVQCMVSEMLGSFILVLVYLTQTEEKYKLSTDAAITLMIISGAYVIGMALSNPLFSDWTQSPLNPAIALAMMTMTTFSGNIGDMNWAWIFLVFSWLGSLLAVLCFEFIFKKAFNAVEKGDEEEEIAHEENVDIAQPLIE